MIFGATLACPRCFVRFASAPRCPACGGTERFDLSRTRPRADFRRRARALRGGGARRGFALAFALGGVAAWVPKRPWIVRALAELASWLEARGFWGADTANLAEASLDDGDEVTVTGTLGKDKGPARGYRDEPIDVLTGTIEAPLLIAKR